MQGGFCHWNEAVHGQESVDQREERNRCTLRI